LLFRQAELARIRTGEITVAFRRLRRPTVVSGGTLRTAIGELAIESVERIREDQISDVDVKCSGHPGAQALKAELARRSGGELYRIEFRVKGPDPRIKLREQNQLGEAEWEDVSRRLQRLDRASKTGPWTRQALEAIAEGEGVRAGDLAPSVGQERDAFKVNIRKLKNLGLTESLGTGYRVSPRGQAVLARMALEAGPAGLTE
jgi:hypothetical protein